MKDKKTTYKCFSIAQYRQEEDYLSSMHEKGWKLTHITFPCAYHFQKCEPQKVSYRLDYSPEGLKNKEEYVQMFKDCGWTYMFDLIGYSYFYKVGEDDNCEREEIYCDDLSRFEMMKKVFRGRMVPLIILFAMVIVPQLFSNTVNYVNDTFNNVMFIMYAVLAIVYLVLFTNTSYWFYQYEKNMTGNDSKNKLKYVGIFAAIVMCFAGIISAGIMFRNLRRSIYSVNKTETGFVVDAEQFNNSVVREYDLKEGDVVIFDIIQADKEVHLSVTEVGKESEFYGNFNSMDPIEYEIKHAGCYEIEVSGGRIKGEIEVKIVPNTNAE